MDRLRDCPPALRRQLCDGQRSPGGRQPGLARRRQLHASELNGLALNDRLAALELLDGGNLGLRDVDFFPRNLSPPSPAAPRRRSAVDTVDQHHSHANHNHSHNHNRHRGACPRPSIATTTMTARVAADAPMPRVGHSDVLLLPPSFVYLPVRIVDETRDRRRHDCVFDAVIPSGFTAADIIRAVNPDGRYGSGSGISGSSTCCAGGGGGNNNNNNSSTAGLLDPLLQDLYSVVLVTRDGHATEIHDGATLGYVYECQAHRQPLEVVVKRRTRAEFFRF
ncbi:MAG: hypothetical protein M1815_004019 [Lichina confinis]|nr:MAG: hypothetical protein M1815_004019 [Lichina confinis]